MCEAGYERQGRGAARADLIELGRDARPFLIFADVTRSYWRRTVCGRCVGDQSAPRCRRHLVQEASQGGDVDARGQGELAQYIFGHITAYARSFRWECRDTETDEDRAALLSAVGWCSGWEAWLPQLCAG